MREYQLLLKLSTVQFLIFITAKVIKDIEESYYVDPIEMAQIKSDRVLVEKLKIGHRDAKEMKGRFIE